MRVWIDPYDLNIQIGYKDNTFLLKTIRIL